MSYGRDGSRNNPFRGIANDKPNKREVFPTSELPHKWAHQTQSRGRNPQGNLFFEGDTIYSYRRSWPLARIHTRGKLGRDALARDSWAEHAPKDAGVLVLVNSARYSVTTSQHQSAVEQAVSHLPVLRVPNVELFNRALPYERDGMLAAIKESHDENLKHFARIADKCLAAAERAMREYSFDSAVATARSAVEHAGQYMTFFGIRRKAPTFDSERYAKALERIQRILNPDPASRDKRERASAQRRAAKAAKEARANERKNLILDPCARTDWRLYGAFDVFRGNYLPREFGPVMLRVNGEEIETSMGARVPLAAAPMVWNAVQRQVARGQARDYSANRALGKPHIGGYPLDRIDADGTLHAGCHVIPYSELAMMARALNL